jgi:hypothetical protein
MTSNGQGPSPQPGGGSPRRPGRGHGARRRDAASPWGLLAAASHRELGTIPVTPGRREGGLSRTARRAGTARPARPSHDDPGADFVLRAMQRAFQ